MREEVERVLGGDREAFRGIVMAYGPRVRAFLAAHLSNPQDVEDLAQETFIAAYEGLDRFDLEGDLARWLIGIARNKFLMHLRSAYQSVRGKERLRCAILTQTSADVAEGLEGDDAEAVATLRQCLDKLEGRIRTVINARYFEAQPVTGIAKALATSATAISSLLFRGRKMLEECIGKGALRDA